VDRLLWFIKKVIANCPTRINCPWSLFCSDTHIQIIK